MRYRFVIIIVLALLFNLYYLGSMSVYSDSILLNSDVVISMDFKDVSLKDLLKVFSIQSGINFIASESVEDRKITLYLDKVPVREAMDQLFKANNLTYEYDELSNIIIVKDWGKPQLETITKTFFLKHASVASSPIISERSSILGSAVTGSGSSAGGEKGSKTGITQAIQDVLSEVGKVVEDPRTNSLTITEIPSRFPVIEAIIGRLDVPVPMVMLEVEMLDVSRNTVDKLGFSFQTNPFTLILRGGFANNADFWVGRSSKRGQEGAVTLGKTYSEILDFLRTQTDTKYLARPRLLTLNNETAEVKISTNESIGIKTTSTSTSEGTASATSSVEAERTETGVVLRVTPQINSDTGEITMLIYPRVIDATSGNTFTSESKNYQFRDPEERSTKSIVKIKDGETVILGGLLRNELIRTTTKIPILGDLPLIGVLFRHTGGGENSNDKNKERELLVFITPRIIKDSPMELAKTKTSERNILPEREQQPLESAIGRQKTIDASLNNFENK